MAADVYTTSIIDGNTWNSLCQLVNMEPPGGFDRAELIALHRTSSSFDPSADSTGFDVQPRRMPSVMAELSSKKDVIGVVGEGFKCAQMSVRTAQTSPCGLMRTVSLLLDTQRQLPAWYGQHPPSAICCPHARGQLFELLVCPTVTTALVPIRLPILHLPPSDATRCVCCTLRRSAATGRTSSYSEAFPSSCFYLFML